MKYIFLNTKRFDIPRELGGVNSLAPIEKWGAALVEKTQEKLDRFEDVEFVDFLPEAHLINAVGALKDGSKLKIGSQSVFREDTAIGGNFGAFTTGRTANAMKTIGCTWTIIGHCEERKNLSGILAEAGVSNPKAVNQILNKEILRAQEAGMKVLYCIGETSEEQPEWEKVLGDQLEIGLAGVDKSRVVIGYEPVWSIGPGKTPADKEYISKISKFVKESTGGIDVVYGGGLKSDNAKMLASIDTIDGGLIALTRFSGDIGFYPDEYLEIVDLYIN